VEVAMPRTTLRRF